MKYPKPVFCYLDCCIMRSTSGQLYIVRKNEHKGSVNSVREGMKKIDAMYKETHR